MVKRVIIDTDPGIDDALALILAFRCPQLRIEAITTVCGNVQVEQATNNVLTILKLLNLEQPPLLAMGSRYPLEKPLLTAEPVHGSDGLGELHRFRSEDGSRRYPDVTLPSHLPEASKVILNLLDRFPDELTLIALGPLTNVGKALMEDAEGMRRLKELVIMGGSINVPGNITPAAEYNIFTDPLAAKMVFASGLPMTLIPLDVTEKVRLAQAEIDELSMKADAALRPFFVDATSRVMQYMEDRCGKAEFVLHDPLTVGVSVDPSLVRTTTLSVDVETKGEITEGMTVADIRAIRDDFKRPPNLSVALEVDAEGFKSFFKERLCQRS